MRVNIVCENDGWIYGKFVEMFRKYSKHDILINSKEPCNATHYLPYYLTLKKPVHPCTAWHSHQESKNPLRDKFVSVARAVDVPISHSKKYADMLKKEYGIEKAIQIIPGVDLDIFKQRSTRRPSNSLKLIVGYVGRSYSSSTRKNSTMLKKISQLPFVEFRSTGGKIKDVDIPKFYADLDIVISPASVEGGPMAIQESLATGTSVLCYEGVGVVDEFGTGVIKVPFGDSDEFISRLEIIHKTKSYLHYRKPEVMNQMRNQVLNQSWNMFVRKHDRIFDEIT
ncbi:hypothetical protein LCGC14_1474360 [marine sediment metagenome]|uniref:Glycosyl transferase family 1 domain-containing protein n=1 Tax=marine sediment metagenome TaxID=412755 RepID=A0A0F9JC29_9ZZZZ